jgi:quercetin dioxygenase-like cupin family protein
MPTRYRTLSRVALSGGAFVVLGVSPCAAQQAAAQQSARQPAAIELEKLTWVDNPNIPPGSKIAWLVGGPGQAALYTFRVRFPASYRVMPHTHPDDRVYTVVSGTWSIGLGTAFDSTVAKSYQPGSVYFLPANTPHFHPSPEGSVAQVTGRGPTATVYVNTADDPRRKP